MATASGWPLAAMRLAAPSSTADARAVTTSVASSCGGVACRWRRYRKMPTAMAAATRRNTTAAAAPVESSPSDVEDAGTGAAVVAGATVVAGAVDGGAVVGATVVGAIDPAVVGGTSVVATGASVVGGADVDDCGG